MFFSTSAIYFVLKNKYAEKAALTLLQTVRQTVTQTDRETYRQNNSLNGFYYGYRFFFHIRFRNKVLRKKVFIVKLFNRIRRRNLPTLILFEVSSIIKDYPLKKLKNS